MSSRVAALLRPTSLSPLSHRLPTAPCAFVNRRWASHESPAYNQPSGYLFGEKPLPKGQKRKWEDWELIYYVGMFGTLACATVVYIYKPDTSIQTWALEEAKKRMEARGDLPQYKPSGQ
ncbi:MAG: hypothetical protein TREMPRED_005904 [Tremellales sp. Tagirdzhanova-0007]|nr:MAG: hypothetical protein TREMPRED_005904 [Tremellales sp. Tagirdzhanova-0007]